MRFFNHYNSVPPLITVLLHEQNIDIREIGVISRQWQVQQ